MEWVLKGSVGHWVRRFGCVGGIFLWPWSAQALVTEPDATVVPIDASSSSDLGCCSNSLANLSLPALFSFLGENLDYRADAQATPQYFAPLCGVTGSLILRGGACNTEFGWYNVDPNYPPFPFQPPPEIYPLVTAQDFANLAQFYPKVPTSGTCDDPPLCTNNAAWQPVRGSGSLANLRNSPNYRGGYIGFAMRGNPGSYCPQSKYSEPRYNQSTNWGGNWISVVMWKSTRLANTYYVGVEDLPMAADNFKGMAGQPYQNDGDFNDFVYLVQGVACPGAGQACSTGRAGACGLGRTECDATGTNVVCVPEVQSSAEICDNFDNDCNGLVDDGAACPASEVCYRGSCVPTCAGGEFTCPTGSTCQATSGLCVEQACVDVSCPAAEVCLGGRCSSGCDGVVCPEGQICQLGRCIDPCATRTCSIGKVCEGGSCVEDCACRSCPSGRECASNGRCVLQGCSNVSCGTGLRCVAGGTCVSVCDGVLCPGGGDCDPVNGQCGPPKPSLGTGGSGAGGGSVGGSDVGGSDLGAAGGAAGAALPLGVGGQVGVAGDAQPGGSGNSGGCGCRMQGRGLGAMGHTHGAIGSLLLWTWAHRRRRRRDARAAGCGSRPKGFRLNECVRARP